VRQLFFRLIGIYRSVAPTLDSVVTGVEVVLAACLRNTDKCELDGLTSLFREVCAARHAEQRLRVTAADRRSRL
jgi:hypothetical protein